MATTAPLGRMLTFYSYKGGTGRSMALANVAWVLASSGRRVLVIDWDLEAPGLHRYFRPFLIDEELTASDGLIDLVDRYANEAIRPVEPETTPDPSWYLPYADFSDHVVSVNFDHFPAGGGIDFLPAGRQNERYAIMVNSFNWQNLYDRLGGGGFFEAVKERARATYDYVLIDSRTGVSDTAGICSVQMPDSLVVCFTYNNQSIKGAAAVAQSAVRMRKKLVEERLARRRAVSDTASSKIDDTPTPYRIFPIPMRVDAGESERLAIRQSFARASFAELVTHLSASDLNEYWTGVEIPQKPFYSYEEVLAAFKDDPQDPKTVLAALVRLTRYITDRDVTDYRHLLGPEEQQRTLDAFAETPLTSLSKRTVAARRETDEEMLARLAATAFAALNDAEKTAARRVFGRLVRLGRDEEGGGYFPIRANIKDFSDDEMAAIRKLANHGVLTISSERFRSPSAQIMQQRVEALPEQAVSADPRLLEAWKPLVNWLDADRDFLLWRQQLRTYLGDWERSGRDPGALLNGQLLSEAEVWARKRAIDLNAAETSYVTDSRAATTTADAQAADEVRRDYAETIREQRKPTEVPSVQTVSKRGLPKSVRSPATRTTEISASVRSWRWTLAAPVAVAASVVVVIYLGRSRPVRPAPSPATIAMIEAVEQMIDRATAKRSAFEQSSSRDPQPINDAISDLSEALGLAAADNRLSRQILSDRAYCYKLVGEWDKSIADLTNALSIDEVLGRTERATLVRDRAYANFWVRDLESALADFQALSAIDSDPPTKTRDYLAATLRARGVSPVPFFVFTDVGPLDQNTPAVIPPSMRLDKYTGFLNLRFWWYPIQTGEIRYTNRDDASLAAQVADTLRTEGFVVGSPVLLGSLVPSRSRRIEMWFPRQTLTRPARRLAPTTPYDKRLDKKMMPAPKQK